MFDLEFIKKLKPCKYKYKQTDENGLVDDNNRTHLGFVAQDLIELLPKDEEYALAHKHDNGYYVVDTAELLAPIVKAIQEIDNRLTNIEKMIKKEDVKDDTLKI